MRGCAASSLMHVTWRNFPRSEDMIDLSACTMPVAYHGGEASPRFQAGGQSCNPPLLDTQWCNAIAGFTSQSLGLPAYACKTGSSTAIKLAPRVHQNLPFWAQQSKKFSDPPRWGERHPPCTPRRLVPRTRRDSSLTVWTADTPMYNVLHLNVIYGLYRIYMRYTKNCMYVCIVGFVYVI